jgi:two-component system, chemotaxis family, protein-glutamate methylesterase/glutaminase
MIRVLIAEDSVTVRELLVAVLSADPEIEIAGTAKNGREAVEMTKRLRPDVVTMDVNMPELGGFEATKQIMIEAPTPIVIISASVEVRDVSISMNALRLGALALLEKPPGMDSPNFGAAVAHLTSTVKAMANVKVVRHWPTNAIHTPPRTTNAEPSTKVRIVAIAASTGGPAALARVLSDLPAQFPVPILIVQHIAEGFIGGLASWLNAVCSLKVLVAKEGDALAPSTIYLAGDGAHMGVGSNSRIKLDRAGPIDGFRPSATYLFDSVGKLFGASALGVILTGMGQDGIEGLRTIKLAGGRVLAQDESSSIVFGMPGAAITQGLVDSVLPLSSIGPRLSNWAQSK